MFVTKLCRCSVLLSIPSVLGKTGKFDPKSRQLTIEIMAVLDGGTPKRRRPKLDDAGRLVRGRSVTPVVQTGNYDAMVRDPWQKYPPQPVEIKKASVYEHYSVLEEIGTGAFGMVHRCVEKGTGNVYAAKFVPIRGGEQERHTVRNEIRTMSELRHPALINLHDAFETDEELVMIYEFMSGGELFEKVSSEHNRMTEEESRNYVRQVCEALQHMHEMSYVHLDLKPENIMFQTKQSDKLKLIDFGLATKLDPSKGVKVTTGTAEFASPEVVLGKDVSFYTDMWSVGVLAFILLSGLSPFGGENDDETLENVKKCDWNMDDEPTFEGISDEAKDFIRRLLILDPKERMSVHQALDHPWLQAQPRRTSAERRMSKQIAPEQFRAVRDRVRRRYDAWPEPLVPIGRVSQYSSLRIHQPERYRIREASFDAGDAQPRFALRPGDADGREGHNATFFCKVLSPMPVRLSWWKNGIELPLTGDKYRMQNNVNDYALTISDLAMEDRGEYMAKAENVFGSREYMAFLNVNAAGQRTPTPRPPSRGVGARFQSPLAEEPPDATVTRTTTDHMTTVPSLPATTVSESTAALQVPMLASSVVRRQRTQMEVPRVVEQRGAPFFTFSLRPRLIQKNNPCKLLCTVTGNPPPKIEWFKDGQPVDEERVQTLYKSGVASLEMFNTRPQDAGVYTCVASNELGQDETSAPVAVETRQSSTGYLQQSHQSAAHAILARSARRSCTRAAAATTARRAQTPGAVPERDAGMPRRSSEKYASLFPVSSTSDIASALSSADQGRQSSVDEDSREWRSASVASDSSTSK
ncbi:hypothetical protein niasHT_035590 [Heterodera trifolii]|uniref:Immunoglobulin I-set domain protein n=1 Tax=Heterodera trifolii TaxID=157864 RepID=A0ABD2IZ33_9BILA